MSLTQRKNRPMHLGHYPLEKITRRETPTTLIIEDEVKRVPRRADGFERAAHGDYGERMQKIRQAAGGARAKGTALRNPIAGSLSDSLLSLVPAHDGEVAADKAPIPDDPKVLAENLKSYCYFLDADQVGICEAKNYTWYSHRKDGTEVEPYHKYAIVILIDQGYETSDASSGDDWMSGSQSARAYMRGAEIGNIVANYIRRLGYSAKCQSAVESDIQHLPLILLAGLGELSRIGEVIINPFLGPRFKSTVVTTDLPLASDKPIDFGLQDFCNKCLKCARECPCSAIPFGGKIMYNGYETWKPDVQNCTGYRVTNHKGQSCGRCLKMCPWNKADFPLYNLGRWMAFHLPFTRGLLARLDDWLGFGNRNPVKKWWFDLQPKDNKLQPPDQTNERDNQPDKAPPANHRIAYYNVDDLPGPNDTGPVPFDRQQGFDLADKLETPDEARKRVGS